MADILEDFSGKKIAKWTVMWEVKRQKLTRYAPEDTTRERYQDLRDKYLERWLEYAIDTIIYADKSSFKCTLVIIKTVLRPRGVRRRHVKPFYRGKSL